MKPFEKRLQRLNREMLVHACIGHPLASVLSLVGLRRCAEFIHYQTLPRRARRRLPRWKVAFDHSHDLILADVLFNPLAHIARSFGKYELCNRIFFSGPWQACVEHGACNMTPDEIRWANDRYEKLTGKSIYDKGIGARASIELEKMGEAVWSGQARGQGPPKPGKVKKGKQDSMGLFYRLMDVRFTRRDQQRIESVLGIELSNSTSHNTVRIAVDALSLNKKQELDRLIRRLEAGSNLDGQ